MSRKQRLNPSKLLVLFLYGDYPYMEVDRRSSLRKIKIQVGNFAKLMRVRANHIVEYIQWLEEMGFLTVVELNKKQAKLIVEKPVLFRSADE